MAIKKRNILVSAIVFFMAVILFGGLLPAIRAAEVGDMERDTALLSVPLEGELQRIGIEPELFALIDDQRNIIIDETGNLAPFIEKLRALHTGLYDGAVNILHIGDSHVQAGFWDGRMREHFSRDFGGGGRGIILPHRLTGTNEPRDYYIRTGNSYESFRATSNDSKQKLSYTGTAVHFDYDYPQVELWSREGFDAVTVIHHRDAPLLSPPASLLLETQCVMGDTEENTIFYLNRKVDTLRLRAHYSPDIANPRPLYYGFVLHGGSGVVYHSLGANSAAFEHFERNTTIPEGGAGQLFPDLIIVSLGTNNCYGRNYRSDNLRKVVERFFNSIAENYPGIPVLITTPRESCQRASGRKYVPNPNIEDAAKVIRETASRYGFGCWDLYSAAGGRGISEKWFDRKLSGRDRIHLSESGYNLVGDMMYDAFVKYYNAYVPAPVNFANAHYKSYYNTNTDTAFIKFATIEIITATGSPA